MAGRVPRATLGMGSGAGHQAAAPSRRLPRALGQPRSLQLTPGPLTPKVPGTQNRKRPVTCSYSFGFPSVKWVEGLSPSPGKAHVAKWERRIFDIVPQQEGSLFLQPPKTAEGHMGHF